MQEKQVRQRLIFYGPIFLLYSIYDGAKDKKPSDKVTGRAYGSLLQEMQIR